MTAKFQGEEVAIELLKRKIHTHQVDVTHHSRRVFSNAIRHADKVKAEGKATIFPAAPVHQKTDTKPKTESNPVANTSTGTKCPPPLISPLLYEKFHANND